MKRTALIYVATTLVAGLTFAQADKTEVQKERPVGRIVGGDALVKEKGRFAETWLHPDETLSHYSEIYLWNVAFQFREMGHAKGAGTEGQVLKSGVRREYPVTPEDRERFEQVVMDAFYKELRRSKKFQMVDEVGPETLIVRGAVMDIISWVPPSQGRIDSYVTALGQATVAFELIDPETGLMQARVGERSNIQLPKGSHESFNKPANLQALWPDVERWGRSVASDLRKDLEKRLKKPKKK